jgi:septum formation protein
MSPPPVVLASTSPTRRALLTQVGLAFEAIAPGVDESLARGTGVERARALALAKARAVADRRPDALVIGSDQVLAFGGEVWGKPATAGVARHQLRRLSGRSHSLISAVAVIAPGREAIVEHEETRLRFHHLTEQEIAAYVALGEWEGCAGGYRVEGRGLALFERIEGDWTNVLGLPMPRLLAILRGFGVRPLEPAP